MTGDPQAGDWKGGIWIRLLLVLALAAAWTDLGRFHVHHVSDSLMHVFVSTQHWTFFFWDQNRYGMLYALLASPVKHPFWNLLLQYWFILFCMMGSFFAVARLAGGKNGSWLAAGFISLLTFLATTPALTVFVFVYQPYAAPLFLGAAGLLLLEEGFERQSAARGLMMAAGSVLVFCCAWVSTPMPLVLGVLLVARWWLDRAAGRGWRQPLVCALVLGISFGVVYTVSFLWPYRWQYEVVPVSRWAEGLWQLWLRVQAFYFGAGKGWFVGALLGAALLLAALRQGGRGALDLVRKGAVAALPALLAALAALFLFGTSDWVRKHDYRPDYGATTYLMLQTWLSLVLAGLLARCLASFRSARLTILGGGTVLMVLVALLYGVPSPGLVRNDLESHLGRDGEDLKRSKASHVLGKFTRVWPAAFYVNWKRWEEGCPFPVHVISAHSTSTRFRWSQTPRSEVLIAIPRGDPSAEGYLKGYGLPALLKVGEEGGLELFVLQIPGR